MQRQARNMEGEIRGSLDIIEVVGRLNEGKNEEEGSIIKNGCPCIMSEFVNRFLATSFSSN